MMQPSTHIGIGNTNMNKICRCGKWNANKIVIATTPPEAPISPPLSEPESTVERFQISPATTIDVR